MTNEEPRFVPLNQPATHHYSGEKVVDREGAANLNEFFGLDYNQLSSIEQRAVDKKTKKDYQELKNIFGPLGGMEKLAFTDKDKRIYKYEQANWTADVETNDAHVRSTLIMAVKTGLVDKKDVALLDEEGKKQKEFLKKTWRKDRGYLFEYPREDEISDEISKPTYKPKKTKEAQTEVSDSTATEEPQQEVGKARTPEQEREEINKEQAHFKPAADFTEDISFTQKDESKEEIKPEMPPEEVEKEEPGIEVTPGDIENAQKQRVEVRSEPIKIDEDDLPAEEGPGEPGEEAEARMKQEESDFETGSELAKRYKEFEENFKKPESTPEKKDFEFQVNDIVDVLSDFTNEELKEASEEIKAGILNTDTGRTHFVWALRQMAEEIASETIAHAPTQTVLEKRLERLDILSSLVDELESAQALLEVIAEQMR